MEKWMSEGIQAQVRGASELRHVHCFRQRGKGHGSRDVLHADAIADADRKDALDETRHEFAPRVVSGAKPQQAERAGAPLQITNIYATDGCVISAPAPDSAFDSSQGYGWGRKPAVCDPGREYRKHTYNECQEAGNQQPTLRH